MDRTKVILKIVTDSPFGPILLSDQVLALANQWLLASVRSSGRGGCASLDGNIQDDRPQD